MSDKKKKSSKSKKEEKKVKDLNPITPVTEEDIANCSYMSNGAKIPHRFDLKPLEKINGHYLKDDLYWNFCSYIDDTEFYAAYRT